MNYYEALDELQFGYKVCRRSWDEGVYLQKFGDFVSIYKPHAVFGMWNWELWDSFYAWDDGEATDWCVLI